MTLDEIKAVVAEAEPVIRRLVETVHERPASACVTYAQIASPILHHMGVRNSIIAGRALWRVAPADDAVVHHVPEMGDCVVSGDFPYHCWLMTLEGYVIDYTTKHLAEKLAMVAEYDNKSSECLWTEPFLVRHQKELLDPAGVIKRNECDAAYGPIGGMAEHYGITPALLDVILIPGVGD